MNKITELDLTQVFSPEEKPTREGYYIAFIGITNAVRYVEQGKASNFTVQIDNDPWWYYNNGKWYTDYTCLYPSTFQEKHWIGLRKEFK